jgi:hypothetical protein
MADNFTTRSAEQRARAQALGLPLPTLPWPRAGVWVIWQGVLAIIAAVGKWQQIPQTIQVPDGNGGTTSKDIVREAIDTADRAYVELHLVETEKPDREGRLGNFKRVPDAFAEQLGAVRLEQDDDPWPEDGSIFITRHNEIRNVPTEQLEIADWSHVGTIIDTRNGGDPRPSNSAGYRMGYILSDEELATLPDAFAAEHQAKLDGDWLSSHPEAQELDAELRAELDEKVAEINARRAELHARLLSERDASGGATSTPAATPAAKPAAKPAAASTSKLRTSPVKFSRGR